jgi:hypothetical protein
MTTSAAMIAPVDRDPANMAITLGRYRRLMPGMSYSAKDLKRPGVQVALPTLRRGEAGVSFIMVRPRARDAPSCPRPAVSLPALP